MAFFIRTIKYPLEVLAAEERFGQRGIGIGLSSVKKIVEALGARSA